MLNKSEDKNILSEIPKAVCNFFSFKIEERVLLSLAKIWNYHTQKIVIFLIDK